MGSENKISDVVHVDGLVELYKAVESGKTNIVVDGVLGDLLGEYFKNYSSNLKTETDIRDKILELLSSKKDLVKQLWNKNVFDFFETKSKATMGMTYGFYCEGDWGKIDIPDSELDTLTGTLVQIVISILSFVLTCIVVLILKKYKGKIVVGPFEMNFEPSNNDNEQK